MPKNHNTTISGASQTSGKSTFMLWYDVMPTVREADCFVGICDPDATMGVQAIGHIMELGDRDRLIPIDLSQWNRFCGWGMFRRSTNPNPFDKAVEDRRFARMIGDILSVHRGEGLDQTRLIKEWCMFAIAFWQGDPTASPEDLPFALLPGTTKFEAMRRNNTDESVLAKAELLKSIFKGNKFYDVIGPSLRLLEELFAEPIIKAMLQQTFDLEQVIEDKGIVVILGGSDEFINRVVMKSFILRCTQIVENHWGYHRLALPVRLYIDEASRILSNAEIPSFRRNIKKGQTYCIANQLATYGTEKDSELDLSIDETFKEKIVMAAGGKKNAEIGAGHLLGLVDENQKTHETERLIHDGYEEIEHVSTQESKGEDGKKRKGKTKGTIFQPIYKTVKDPHFRPLNEQLLLLAQKIVELNLGQYFRRFGPEVSGPHQGEKLPLPFQFDGLMEDELELLYEQLLEQGIYRRIMAACAPAKAKSNGTQPTRKGKQSRPKS